MLYQKWLSFPTDDPGGLPDSTPIFEWLTGHQQSQDTGLWFAARRSPMDHYLWNFKDNLDKIRGICDSWFNRDLSIKGKITVVSSLLISLLQYAASNSELPKQVLYEMKKIVTHFVWNKRKAKIVYATLIQDVGGGGLKLADLELRSNIAKLGWVRKILNNMDSFSGQFISLLAGEASIQCLLHGKPSSLPDRFRASTF